MFGVRLLGKMKGLEKCFVKNAKNADYLAILPRGLILDIFRAHITKIVESNLADLDKMPADCLAHLGSRFLHMNGSGVGRSNVSSGSSQADSSDDAVFGVDENLHNDGGSDSDSGFGSESHIVLAED